MNSRGFERGDKMRTRDFVLHSIRTAFQPEFNRFLKEQSAFRGTSQSTKKNQLICAYCLDEYT
jgi:hypothetical protein